MGSFKTLWLFQLCRMAVYTSCALDGASGHALVPGAPAGVRVYIRDGGSAAAAPATPPLSVLGAFNPGRPPLCLLRFLTCFAALVPGGTASEATLLIQWLPELARRVAATAAAVPAAGQLLLLLIMMVVLALPAFACDMLGVGFRRMSAAVAAVPAAACFLIIAGGCKGDRFLTVVQVRGRHSCLACSMGQRT